MILPVTSSGEGKNLMRRPFFDETVLASDHAEESANESGMAAGQETVEEEEE